MKNSFKITIFIILIALSFLGCNKDNFDASIKIKNNTIDVNGNNVEIDGSTITITQSGEYRFSGSGENVQIIVDCKESVYLKLDDVQIYNDKDVPIVCKSIGTLIIETVGKKQSSLSNAVHKGRCIESEGDLSFAGETTLNLKGYHCIECKGNILLGGTVNIQADGDGIRGDTVDISCLALSISAKSDAVQAKDINIHSGEITVIGAGDDSWGVYAEKDFSMDGGSLQISTHNDCVMADENIVISGGSILLNTLDDAISADETVEIYNGSINIESCYEGIESGQITINGGNILIVAQNDGINAAYHDDEKKSAYVYINGGSININADGDGVDANGSIYINGGTLFVSGAYGGDNNAIDFDDEFVITGGTVIAAGNNIKAKPVSQDSTQNSIMFIFESYQTNEEDFIINDKDGNTLCAVHFDKKYDSLIYSSNKLIKGETYYYELANGVKLGQFTVAANVELVWCNK